MDDERHWSMWSAEADGLSACFLDDDHMEAGQLAERCGGEILDELRATEPGRFHEVEIAPELGSSSHIILRGGART